MLPRLSGAGPREACPDEGLIEHGREALLKAAIVIFMLALVASLGSGFYFLMVDQGDKTKRRTFHSLGVRLTLAIGLAALIIYGVASGRAPHEARLCLRQAVPGTGHSAGGH